MQLEVQQYDLPKAILFNYDEIKQALTEKVHFYETAVYTDEQIKQAKSDRADLNKLKDALNSERIRLEKEYMIPFNDFKTKINELIDIIKKPVGLIDVQIKEFEQKKKEEKKEQILGLFNEAGFPDYIPFDKVFNEAWLNSSCSLARVKEDLKTLVMKDEKAVQAIGDLPEYSFEAMEYYKKTLDLADAMARANELARIARAKAEAEKEAARKAEEQARQAELDRIAEEKRKAEQLANEAASVAPAEQPKEEPGQWLRFEAYLTKTTAAALAEFMKSNNIAFRPIK